MMNTADQQKIDGALTKAKHVARNIIQELRDRPLYTVMISREVLGSRMGMYYRGLDAALRPQLEAVGRWQGPGACIAIDAFALFATAENDDDGERNVIGSVLHELAHWLNDVEPERNTTTFDDLVTAMDDLREAEAQPQQFSHAFLTHGDDFIRLCVHLWYRSCNGGGCVLCPHWLRFGSEYDETKYLDRPPMYIEALDSELEVLKDLPLRQVAAIEPPAEFTALWDRTLTRMFLRAESAA